MSDEEKKKANLLLSDAILAIIIPVAGYYVAYQYELGRAGYFGISGSLVEVGLTNVLQVIVYLFASYLLILGYLGHKENLAIAKSPVLRAFSLIFMPLLIILGLIIYVARAGALLFMLLGFATLLIFAVFVFPLISQRRVKGYKNKLAEQMKGNQGSDSNDSSLLGGYRRKYGLRIYAAIIVAIFALIYMSFFGSVVARNQSSFEVLASTPELVVLARYSSRLVCAEVDREKKEIKNAYYIRTLDQVAEQGIRISRENVGPFKITGKDRK